MCVYVFIHWNDELLRVSIHVCSVSLYALVWTCINVYCVSIYAFGLFIHWNDELLRVSINVCSVSIYALV